MSNRVFRNHMIPSCHAVLKMGASLRSNADGSGTLVLNQKRLEISKPKMTSIWKSKLFRFGNRETGYSVDLTEESESLNPITGYNPHDLNFLFEFDNQTIVDFIGMIGYNYNYSRNRFESSGGKPWSNFKSHQNAIFVNTSVDEKFGLIIVAATAWNRLSLLDQVFCISQIFNNEETDFSVEPFVPSQQVVDPTEEMVEKMFSGDSELLGQVDQES